MADLLVKVEEGEEALPATPAKGGAGERANGPPAKGKGKSGQEAGLKDGEEADGGSGSGKGKGQKGGGGGVGGKSGGLELIADTTDGAAKEKKSLEAPPEPCKRAL